MLLKCSQPLFIGDLRSFTKILQLAFGKNLQLQLIVLFFLLGDNIFLLSPFTLVGYDYNYCYYYYNNYFRLSLY